MDELISAETRRHRHLRAFHKRRNLECRIANGWQIATLERPNTAQLSAQILKRTEEQERIIENFVFDADTKLGEELK